MSRFWVDLLSCIPFDFIFQYSVNNSAGSSNSLGSIRLIKMLRLLRMFKLVRVLKLGKMSKQLERLNISAVVFGVLRLLIGLWFFAHLMACIFVWIALNESIGNPSWIRNGYTFGDISYLKDMYLYEASFYWVLATMFSVGYGDFTPRSDQERLFSMGLMLCGKLLDFFIIDYRDITSLYDI